MRLPRISSDRKTRDLIDVFGGYNHNLRIGDNEFYDMKNMSSDAYPLLSVRAQRGNIPAKYILSTRLPANKGMIFRDWLYYVAIGERTGGEGSPYNIYLVGKRNDDVTIIGAWISGKTGIRTIVPMGAKLIILPDKLVVNTAALAADATQNPIPIENIKSSGGTLTIQPCLEDGTALSIDYSGEDEPENPTDGYIWLDTSINSVKKYYANTSMWQPFIFSHIKISDTSTNRVEIGEGFAEGDGITISGITAVESLNGNTIISCIPDEYSIVVAGTLDGLDSYTQSESATFSRKMPKMDYVIESQNRLWGCRYGYTEANERGEYVNGEFVNEIYCSKLGDEKNWEVYQGISTDSYRATVGTEGAWTGAVNYRGYPVFFKERHIHTVLGNYPPYQISSSDARGVQVGSSDSLAVVNEILFYKSSHGICAYTGGMPADVSAAFGGVKYTDAIACGYKDKYYVCMKDVSENPVFFVYDTVRNLWHKEDNLYAEQFAVADDNVFYITKSGNNYITGALFKADSVDIAPIDWYAESGILGLSMIDKKYISRINLRLSLPGGSYLFVSIMYDSSGEWIPYGNISGNNLLPFTLHIKPRRCDHFRIRLEGRGDIKLYSVSKTYEQGSDR